MLRALAWNLWRGNSAPAPAPSPGKENNASSPPSVAVPGAAACAVELARKRARGSAASVCCVSASDTLPRHLFAGLTPEEEVTIEPAADAADDGVQVQVAAWADDDGALSSYDESDCGAARTSPPPKKGRKHGEYCVLVKEIQGGESRAACCENAKKLDGWSWQSNGGNGSHMKYICGSHEDCGKKVKVVYTGTKLAPEGALIYTNGAEHGTVLKQGKWGGRGPGGEWVDDIAKLEKWGKGPRLLNPRLLHCERALYRLGLVKICSFSLSLW